MSERFENIGKLVKQRREASGFTQREFSLLLGYKLNNSGNGQIASNIERFACGLPLKRVKVFCNLTNTPYVEVLEAMKLDLAVDFQRAIK